MPFLISMVTAAAGIVVMLTVLLRLRGQVRRLSDTVGRRREQLVHRTEMLAARISALRTALNQRRRSRGGSRSVPAA